MFTPAEFEYMYHLLADCSDHRKSDQELHVLLLIILLLIPL